MISVAIILIDTVIVTDKYIYGLKIYKYSKMQSLGKHLPS
jgi:hypothetical protein